MSLSNIDIQFPTASSIAQGDYVKLFQPNGSAYVFWPQTGSLTQPSAGTATYHEVLTTGDANSVCNAMVQSAINTGLWSCPGFTLQTAPTIILAPALSTTSPASGDTVTCSQGTWNETPTSYLYQWKVDGINSGSNTSTNTFTAGSNGTEITCAVTATNGAGNSTPALTSNSATVTVASTWYYNIPIGNADTYDGLNIYRHYQPYVSPMSGNCTKIAIGIGALNFGLTYKLALCNASKSILAQGTVTVLATGYAIVDISTVTLVSGTTYGIEFQAENSAGSQVYHQGSGTGAEIDFSNTTYALTDPFSGGAFPNVTFPVGLYIA